MVEAPIISFQEAKFMAWDVDEDGLISREDIRKLVSQFDRKISETTIDAWMALANVDRDGQIPLEQFTTSKMWVLLTDYLKDKEVQWTVNTLFVLFIWKKYMKKLCQFIL